MPKRLHYLSDFKVLITIMKKFKPYYLIKLNLKRPIKNAVLKWKRPIGYFLTYVNKILPALKAFSFEISTILGLTL